MFATSCELKSPSCTARARNTTIVMGATDALDSCILPCIPMPWSDFVSNWWAGLVFYIFIYVRYVPFPPCSLQGRIGFFYFCALPIKELPPQHLFQVCQSTSPFAFRACLFLSPCIFLCPLFGLKLGFFLLLVFLWLLQFFLIFSLLLFGASFRTHRVFCSCAPEAVAPMLAEVASSLSSFSALSLGPSFRTICCFFRC